MDFAALQAMLDADDLDLGGLRDGLGELSKVSEGANARIAELEAENSELSQKYTETAAKLWEMTQAATAPADEGEGEGDEGEDEEPESDEELFGDLFEEKK
nr:MAG TPA: hypothetical protein [Caudoviricetes sp.]